MLLHRGGLVVHCLADSWARQHCLHPAVVVGVFARNVDFIFLENEWNESVPCDERKIRVRALVADQPLLASKSVVKYANNALHLFEIALSGGWELL